MIFNRRLFKEAFIRGYKEAKRRLNETTLQDLGKRYFDKRGSFNDKAESYQSGRGAHLNELLKNLSGDKHLERYTKQYLRYLSLTEYLLGIYKRGEKPKQKDSQELYKTYKAALADLDELDQLVERGLSGISGTFKDGYDKKEYVLGIIEYAKRQITQYFKRWYVDLYEIPSGDLDPKGNISKKEQRRAAKTNVELDNKEKDYWNNYKMN